MHHINSINIKGKLYIPLCCDVSEWLKWGLLFGVYLSRCQNDDDRNVDELYEL